MNMITRIMDDKGRIHLPLDMVSYFQGGLAYFGYRSKVQLLDVVNESYLLSVRNCQQKILNRDEFRNAFRSLCSSMASSSFQSGGRLVIPEKIRNYADFHSGDYLTIVMEKEKIAIRKFQK